MSDGLQICEMATFHSKAKQTNPLFPNLQVRIRLLNSFLSPTDLHGPRWIYASNIAGAGPS